MWYFAYGSNMNPQRLAGRGIRFVPEARAVGMLDDYEMRPTKVSGTYPGYGAGNISPKQGSVVEGVLFRIPDADIEKLDIFESYPRQYTRKHVPVRTRDGRRIMAVTYMAQPDWYREGLLPHPEYWAHVLAGAKGLLSEEYIVYLEACACAP